jgi:hypothetical protein
MHTIWDTLYAIICSETIRLFKNQINLRKGILTVFIFKIMHIVRHFNTITAAILIGHFEFMVIHHLTIMKPTLNLVTPKKLSLTRRSPFEVHMYDYYIS